METHSNKVIFIVSEDLRCRNIFSTMVQKIPHLHLEFFERAEEAFLNLSHSPDLLFLDEESNKKKGKNFIPYFRKELPFLHVSLITNRHDISVIEQVIEMGGDDCVAKDAFSIADALHKAHSYSANRVKHNVTKAIAHSFPSEFNKRSIYILDDNENFAFTLKYIVNKSPMHQAFMFNNSTSMIQQCKASSADVLLLDYNLNEGCSGLDVLLMVKEFSPATEVIVLSGTCDLSIAARFLKSGASYIMQKSEHNLRKINAVIDSVYASPYERAIRYIKNVV